MYIPHVMDNTIKKAKSQIANFITLCNLSFGGAAIMATLNEHYSSAVLFIFIAALLDRYDGKVARRLNQQSELGKQLDSMSDIISFGVAPAILIYEYLLHDLGAAGMIVTVLFITCGALRLARFNISESNGTFVGLPITAAGTILTVSYFLAPVVPLGFYIPLVLVLALLMISTFTMKKV